MRIFGGLLALVISIPALAQGKKENNTGPQIQFSKTGHDFGVVYEDINYAKTRFVFVNSGTKKLFISNVASSCGCTTPDWTRDSIAPGDSGFVDARYETINRIGTFRKTITVFSNATNSPFVHLDIYGEVKKNEPTVNGIAIPDYGKVYFEPATLEFKPLYDTKSDTQFVRIINGTPFSTHFSTLSPQANVTMIGMPQNLEPGESAEVMVIVNGKSIKGYGFGAFQIPVTCDNPVSPDLGLFVAYTRKQFFPKMNAKQLSKAPKIKWDKESYDFGEHVTGETMSADFKVTNAGGSDLIFREIYPECSCVSVKYDKTVLKPGESMVIHLIYDSVAKKGDSHQSVWIVCNDPTRDEMRIHIHAKLPEKAYHCPTCK